MPRPRVRSRSGPSTRSWKDGSSSARSSVGAAVNACMTANDLLTPRASLVKTPIAVSILMDQVSERDRLLDWERAKGEEALVEYRENKNAKSIDGLPGYGESESGTVERVGPLAI